MRRNKIAPVSVEEELTSRRAKLFILTQNLSRIVMKDKKFIEAIQYYDMYLQGDPDSVTALSAKKELLINISKICLQDGQLAESRRYLSDAHRIAVAHENFNNQIARGYLTLAKTYAAQNNHTDAIDCFVLCRQVGSLDHATEAEALIGEVRSHIRNRQWVMCSPLLSRAGAIIPDKQCVNLQAASLEYHALVARRNNAINKAIPLYKQLLQLEPDNILALSGIGCLCRKTEPALSLQCLDKALIIDPRDKETWSIKAMLHKAQDETELEQLCYDKILELEPNNVTAALQREGLFTRKEREAKKREAGKTLEDTRVRKKR